MVTAIDPLDDDPEISAKFRQKSKAVASSNLILDNVLELREYDIPFHLRVSIDFGKGNDSF